MSKEFLNKRELIETITPVIENTAMRYGLIPLEILFEKENDRHYLRIFIYSTNHNVSHLDCENISRGLGDMLDEIIPFKYFLEVSSPGLNRKFKSAKEYIIFKGHSVTVKLKNPLKGTQERIINGILKDYSESYGIKIELKNKEYTIPMNEIQSTRLDDEIEINKNKGEYND